MRFLLLSSLCFWALVGLVGCGESGRYTMSGTVRFKGQPVPLGDIRFEPDPARGGKGPGTSASILNGQFRTPPEFGVVAGPHRIIIRGFDGKNAPPGGGGGPAPYVGMPLFPEYEMSLDLEPRTQRLDIEVPEPSRS